MNPLLWLLVPVMWFVMALPFLLAINLILKISGAPHLIPEAPYGLYIPPVLILLVCLHVYGRGRDWW